VGGAHYYVCFPDDYSKYRRVFATKSVVDSLQKFMKDVKTAVRVIKVLLSDGDKKFNSQAVQEVLEE
jgi:hypothetical protein